MLETRKVAAERRELEWTLFSRRALDFRTAKEAV
jgi:hypothetical protein